MDAVSFHPSLIALQQIQGCSDATTASIPHAMLLSAATKFSTIWCIKLVLNSKRESLVPDSEAEISEGSRPVEAAQEQRQKEECSLLCFRRDSNFLSSRCNHALRDSLKRAHRFGVA